MVSLSAWHTSGWGPHSTPRVSPEPTASSPRSEESTGTHARPLRVCEPREAWLSVWGSDRALIRGAERGGSSAGSSPVAQLRLLQAHFLLLEVTKNVYLPKEVPSIF